jgi:hypothetical protein
MTTIADLEQHFLRLCAEEEADINWCDRPSKALAISGEFEFIRAPRIRSVISYAVAMHELGHIKGRNQYSTHQIVRERWLGIGRGATLFCGRRVWNAMPSRRCIGTNVNAFGNDDARRRSQPAPP